MRIAIFGVGGAGGYFGAHLAQAGEDIILIARGAHLRAIKETGLRLEKPYGEVVVRAPATDSPTQVGAVDVVIVGVKAWQVIDAARAMQPMIGSQTFVVPLQNGIEAATQLATVLGANHVVGGLCGTISWIVEPGHIHSIGETNFVKFGELGNRASERTERLCEIFKRANIKAEIPSNIQAALWEKFIFGASYGGVGAVTQAPVGVIRSLPETRRMLIKGMQEISEVARAHQISLADGIVEKSMALLDSLDQSSITSLQRDIMAGKPSELDAWSGAVVRLGREVGVPTPVNEFIYQSLLPSELRARGAVDFPGSM